MVADEAINSVEDVVRQARQTFGDTLPKDFLSAEEYALYERLYGPPVRETRGDDITLLRSEGDEAIEARERDILLSQNNPGESEEKFSPGDEGWEVGAEEKHQTDIGSGSSIGSDIGLASQESFEDLYEIGKIKAKTQREIDAIMRLKGDMAAARAEPIEELDEEYDEEEAEEEENYPDEETDAYLSGETRRAHAHTIVGRFGTSPTTINLPQEQFVLPIMELLGRTNKKHLSKAAEKAFGGPGLPFSISTPESKKLLPQRHIGLDAAQNKMTEIEADAYMSAVMPGVYASVMSTLVETRKRLGTTWLRNLLLRPGEGPRVLDAGGSGAGIIAWQEMLRAEWDILRDESVARPDYIPYGKSTVLTGPLTLRYRISRLLQNTTFLPRLPDYVHSAKPEALIDGSAAQGRKVFDVIIAPHTLFPLKDDFRRKNMVQNFWQMLDPHGGVLILIEKGIPRGFEAIAGARAHLLKYHISSPSSTHFSVPLESLGDGDVQKEAGMIIAPCTNHMKCPMYKIEGLSSGRKDFCHFEQRYIRPGFLQNILGASARNHEDVKFSYLAVRRGIDLRSHSSVVCGDEATEAAFAGHKELPLHETDGQANPQDQTDSLSSLPFSPFSLPRIILAPLKRKGHVTLDLCTPSGTLERWVVPKSFSRQAYRDARKSRHGDLWALGAKTRVSREARIGRKLEVGDDGKVRKGQIIKDKKKRRKADVFEIGLSDAGVGEIRQLSGNRVDRDAKRTKGGRVQKRKKGINDEDLEDDDDEDDDEEDFK